jgi:hypothetical protein
LRIFDSGGSRVAERETFRGVFVPDERSVLPDTCGCFAAMNARVSPIEQKLHSAPMP